MPRPPTPHPTDGELEILRVLWAQGASSLSRICEALRREREVATTTVASMLKIMLDKGLVNRTGAARGATWSAAVTHQTAAKRMVRKLVDHLFDGSADRLVAHMIEGGQLSKQQLNELRTLMENDGRKKAQ